MSDPPLLRGCCDTSPLHLLGFAGMAALVPIYARLIPGFDDAGDCRLVLPLNIRFRIF